MGAPQTGHAERGARRLRRSGSRAITKLRKLPSSRPNTATTARLISEVVPRHDLSRGVGMQLAEDRELLTHLDHVAHVAIHQDEPDARLNREWLLPGGRAKLRERFVVAPESRKRSEERRVGKECVSLCRSR